MRVKQLHWNEQDGWNPQQPDTLGIDWDLLLCFWSADADALSEPLAALRSSFPGAIITGCSTAGEIHQDHVLDDSLSVTLVGFDFAKATGARVAIENPAQSREAGRALADRLPRQGLRHTLIFSSGLGVNGSELARGVIAGLPEGASVSGGLAGDGDRFSRTFVLWDGEICDNCVVGLGLYGDALHVGCGSKGGWDVFGPERLITSSSGNVLYEMDGESALALYEKYLGKQAAGLPATGLLFPLSIRQEGREESLVRTILSIDRERQSMTFAGDVPVGAYAQLMKANFDRLVDGATDAAQLAMTPLRERLGPGTEPDLALLISCVGRKLILKQMVEEEVESVADVVGADTPLTGFYSYGELAPGRPDGTCELHNQTMTITAICER
ncbi:FIST signal transduction protein [Paucidesulfovibrio longus]|uniref:FIST signal transduction protein n=1 Tax=Paucidesulfovibrio longus TaxID=889 RepID=UPI0003B7AC68|nr:FIST N-terminal domain-containing protein [Paucidesulfovibrio longus]